MGDWAMADSQVFPRTLRVGIFIFPGFEPIDVFGFTEASQQYRERETDCASRGGQGGEKRVPGAVPRRLDTFNGCP